MERGVRAVPVLKVSAAAWGRLDEAGLARYLYTAGLPDPDLLIRTGGDQRISNFLLWQSSYSELYFTDPDGILMQLQDISYCGGGGYFGDDDFGDFGDDEGWGEEEGGTLIDEIDAAVRPAA